ncbi:hypothetical protein [Pseudorhodoferax sp.]|uniref:hypothetical protein n=1 Tax=Pseudorhodoferax sp. TaxID=1993553 RepID=UPI002DD67EA5|nr:hypothetical protein [Pseudorhodoferax sp.]
MAKRQNADVIRRRIGSDLLRLEQIIQRSSGDVIINPEAIKSAVNIAQKTRGDSQWEYSIDNLQMRVDLPQNSLPRSCIGPLHLTLDLEVGGECSGLEDGDLKHLILNLSMSVGEENFCAWHFDRHIGEEESVDVHPLYHFQHGGHAMEVHDGDLGKSLLISAPRLAFPPMDAILAIDFVISNFSGRYWRELREDPSYINLLKGSQEFFWKPYLKRVASWWDPGPKDSDSIQSLFPHLA